jgi:hypothetical protein
LPWLPEEQASASLLGKPGQQSCEDNCVPK